jgi:hypothetical protein
MTDIHWAAYIRADNLTPELCRPDGGQTGMNYFRDWHHQRLPRAGAQNANGL